MNKIRRNKVIKPDCLERNAEAWTNHYIKQRKSNNNYWNWHTDNYERVERILTPILSNISNFHCSYCGIYPLKQNVGGRSIDHFKPKSEFPELAFEWTNLFIACPDCQNIKGNNYPLEIEPLKPDSCHYHFDYWFEIDWTINKNYIIPNKDRNDTEKKIAQETINWLGLNKGDRPDVRYDELEKYKDSSVTDIWRWSYPYFLERG